MRTIRCSCCKKIIKEDIYFQMCFECGLIICEKCEIERLCN